jgi:ABC-type amino acid transport substrate-binding protein
LVISIVAVMIMAVGLTNGVRENAKVHSASESVKAFKDSRGKLIAAGNMTYSGITVSGLQSLGICLRVLMPQCQILGEGYYAVAPNTDTGKVDISLTGVGNSAASRLSVLFVTARRRQVIPSGNMDNNVLKRRGFSLAELSIVIIVARHFLPQLFVLRQKYGRRLQRKGQLKN